MKTFLFVCFLKLYFIFYFTILYLFYHTLTLLIEKMKFEADNAITENTFNDSVQ